MHRKSFIESLEAYRQGPFFTQEEESEFQALIEFVRQTPDCFERHRVGHVTGSAWLINHDGTKVLLTLHKKAQMWLQLGGHADGNPNIAEVALKEAEEESGIHSLEYVMPQIFDIGVHQISGQCVMHYDVRYLIQASKDAQYVISHESDDLAWVTLEMVPNYSKERSLSRMAEKASQQNMLHRVKKDQTV